jgi:DnaJ-class molecular chaperone
MIPVCQKCHGEGKIETTTPDNTKYRTYDPCDQCEGSGKDTEWVICSVCNGTGSRWDLEVALSGDNGYMGKCPICNGHMQIRKVM